MSVEIIQGDCLTVMEYLADGSIDMILTDLPYGTTQNTWDAVVPFAPMWAHFWRLCPDGAVVLTASQPFTSALGASQLAQLRYSWMWRKSAATGHLNAKRMPMKQHEDVLVFGRRTPPYQPQGLQPFGKKVKRGSNGGNFGVSGTENYQEFTNYPRSVLDFPQDKPVLHPTQKPIALFEYLIRTYTNEGDTVLDCCAGSGTTGVAARNTGRNAILIEKDAGYVSIARQRLHLYETTTDKVDVFA